MIYSLIGDNMKKFLIKILNKIQDRETEKPIEKMNPDLILKYSKLILKLRGISADLTEEEVSERVNKIFYKNK